MAVGFTLVWQQGLGRLSPADLLQIYPEVVTEGVRGILPPQRPQTILVLQ